MRQTVSVSNALLTRSLVGLIVWGIAGCDTGPTAPPPRIEVNTDTPDYDPVNPGATPVPLGLIPLTVDMQPIELPALGVPHPNETLAFTGTVQHPDERMIGGVVLVQLLRPRRGQAPGEPIKYDIMNESGHQVTGAQGRLDYRVELKVPERRPMRYLVRMTYLGFKPGQDVNGPPESWHPVFCEGTLDVP